MRNCKVSKGVTFSELSFRMILAAILTIGLKVGLRLEAGRSLGGI